MLCSRCKKRIAMVFVAREINGKMVQEGLCLKCAKDLNIPQVEEITQKMGISYEDIDNMSQQVLDLMEGQDFQLGGAETLNPFLRGAFSSEKNEDINSQTDNISFEESKNNKLSKTGKEKKKKEKFKFLSSFGMNLTDRARKGSLDNIIGRDREIYRVIQILSRRTKNNPCLIGEPGVGKTAIAEGIAQQIAEGKAPLRLADKELYLLDMAALVAGTQFRGQFESRVKGLISEIRKAGNIILFIDEIHTLIGTGDSEGSMSAANILKPALSRGEIQLIGATTFDEYRKYIESDSALERRFQPVSVEEPSISDTTKILKGIRKYYEEHHKVKITDSIVYEAATLSERYITDRFLPDKAIDLLDEAAACCSLASPELIEYEKLNKTLKKFIEKEDEITSESEEPDYEKLATVKSEISKIKDELKQLEPKVAQIYVTSADIAKVIELWTGIPASKIEQSDMQKLKSLEKSLKERIIGQDEAVNAVATAVRRRRVQLSKRRRPASFIFVGPTGVGKTELVKVLAETLFDGVEPLIRLDMSEYMEKHAVSRLVGSPPGYVGYDDAGQLTEKVRRHPYSVVLFDEIEKAHPDVMNILLQILDEGRITDSHGKTVNFENTVIIMTSNAGSGDKSGIVGFNKTESFLEGEKAKNGLSSFLRPEFLSRVDEIISFRKLEPKDLQKIAGLALKELSEVLDERGIALTFDDKATVRLIEKVKDSKYGARDLRKEIRRQVEDAIAAMLIQGMEIESIFISANENELLFSIDGAAAKPCNQVLICN